MEALKQPTIRVVAVIAEGVPEGDTKKLIAYARSNNKVRSLSAFLNKAKMCIFPERPSDFVILQVVIGPATVGGIQAGAFKIGDTAGTLDNIIRCKLYRPGSVGFVSKSVCAKCTFLLLF